MKESLRAIIIFLLAVLSTLLLLIGLMAPLTPSEGVPELSEYLVFIGLPLVFPLIGYVISKKRTERVFSIATEMIVAIIAGWWAWYVGRFFWTNV